ncbi:MAG: hypothetical protein ACRD5J_07210 [Nitrososphaeraceae archaeon]
MLTLVYRQMDAKIRNDSHNGSYYEKGTNMRELWEINHEKYFAEKPSINGIVPRSTVTTNLERLEGNRNFWKGISPWER